MENEANISPVTPEPESPPQSPDVPLVAEPDGSHVSIPPEAAPRDEPYPFWGYSDLIVFFGLALPCMFLGAVVVKFFVHVFHLYVGSMALELVPAQFLGYGFLFFTLYLLLKFHYGRPFWQSLRWVRTERSSAARSVLYGFILAFVVVLLGTALRTPDLQTPMKQLLSDRKSVLLISIFAITLGPLCEELAFRGFLQPVLVRSFGQAGGVVLAAIPFGLLHLSQYGGSWRHGLLITIAGIGFGAMRHLSGSTRAAAIMHAGYNCIFFIALFQEGNLPRSW